MKQLINFGTQSINLQSQQLAAGLRVVSAVQKSRGEEILFASHEGSFPSTDSLSNGKTAYALYDWDAADFCFRRISTSVM